MRCEPELTRRILEEIEAWDGRGVLSGQVLAGRMRADARMVNLHLHLLGQDGWIRLAGKPHFSSRELDEVPDLVRVVSLTGKGRSFLSAARRPGRWASVVQYLSDKAVDVSLAVLLQVTMRG